MGGRAREAIEIIEAAPEQAERDFVLNATLGLAHLANGDIDQGMRIYRDAADEAEKAKPVWRSLMTIYQGLIVRQLGLDKTTLRDSSTHWLWSQSPPGGLGRSPRLPSSPVGL